MICSNRKTRVFDPSGHETFIAHVSLIRLNAFASCFAELTAKPQSDSTRNAEHLTRQPPVRTLKSHPPSSTPTHRYT